MTFWVMEKCTFFQMYFLRKKIENERDMRSSSEMILNCWGVYPCAANMGWTHAWQKAWKKGTPSASFWHLLIARGGGRPLFLSRETFTIQLEILCYPKNM